MIKRLFSVLLVLCMVLALLPGTALAAGVVASGDCGAEGSNVQWSLDDEGTLTISGTGAMADYHTLDLTGTSTTSPWYNAGVIDRVTSIVIASGITWIGNYAFNGCSNATTLVISDSVTAIGDFAFRYCKIEAVELPNSVQEIGVGCFADSSLKEIQLSNSLLTIGAGAFQYCRQLASISIPRSVTEIGAGAFGRCDQLTSISVESSNSRYYATDNVLYDSKEAALIQYPIGDSKVLFQIPDGVKIIGYDSFACSNLSAVVLPESLTAIETCAFIMCDKLTGIDIPANVTHLGGWAFEFCSSLTSARIFGEIENIPQEAFAFCGSLCKISISDSVQFIGSSAFQQSHALGDVYYSGTQTQWSDIKIESQSGNDTNLHDEVLSTTAIHCLDGDIINRKPLTAPCNVFASPDALSIFVNWDIIGHYWNVFEVKLYRADDASSPLKSEIFKFEKEHIIGSSTHETFSGKISATDLTSGTYFYTVQAITDGEKIEGERAFTNSEITTSSNFVYTKQEDAPDRPIEPDTPTDPDTPITDKLDEIIGKVDATAEEIRDILENISRGDIKDAIDKIGDGIFDRIEALEERIGGSAEIEVAAGMDMVRTDIKVIGAKLNFDYSKEVKLQVGLPEDGSIQVPNPGTETFRFSLKLLEGAHNNIAELSVPVKITMPIPGLTMRPKSFTLWHDHNGKLVPVTLSQAPYQGADGKWYISFKVEGFSDFIMTYDKETPDSSTSGSSSGGGSSVSSYIISIPGHITGGAVQVDHSSARAGDTVTITTTSNTGYKLDKLIVTDGKNNEIKLTRKNDDKYAFIMPASSVKVDASFVELEPAETPWVNPYLDVEENVWYYDAVKFVCGNGLMNGYNNGLFGVNDNLSRSQFAQILYNEKGKPLVNQGSGFDDVDAGAWYTNAVSWVAAQGIVNGYGNGMFGPNDNITREQLAVMLWRYSGSPAVTNKELNFYDAGEASGYAVDALCWAIENRIINGYGDGQLDPKGFATRAQVAQMLKNYLEH